MRRGIFFCFNYPDAAGRRVFFWTGGSALVKSMGGYLVVLIVAQWLRMVGWFGG